MVGWLDECLFAFDHVVSSLIKKVCISGKNLKFC